MSSLLYQQHQSQVLSNRVDDAFIGTVAHGAAILPLAHSLSQAQGGPLMPSIVAQDSYSPSSYYQDQFVQAQVLDGQLSNNTDAGSAVTVPTDMQKNNQEQIAALVSSREREVTELQTTLAVPLAHFNAKFIWHCIMNIERDCEPAFLEKILTIHKTFYLPPAVSFYALWLHFRFWDQMPQVYYTAEALLPPATNSTASLTKAARVAIILYMMAASFANKHLDDFSYRNSSWYEAARMPGADFLQIELLALKELHWSLEISSKDWSNWLLHLRTSNITLERTRPTTQTFHFVVARLIQDAIIASGNNEDSFGQAGAYGRYGGRHQIVTDVKKPNLWQDSSPTLVASSHGASPPATDGLHARVNGNIADGPYGLYALQRKLESVQRDPTAFQAPKYIPWDTSLDPVVHVQSRSRSNSGSGMGPLMGEEMKGAAFFDSVNGVRRGRNGTKHGHSPSEGQWPRQSDMYGGGGYHGEYGKPVALGPTNGYGMLFGGGSYGPVSCEDVLSGRRGAQPILDHTGSKGMLVRPFKTCNVAEVPFVGYAIVDPALVSWQMRL